MRAFIIALMLILGNSKDYYSQLADLVFYNSKNELVQLDSNAVIIICSPINCKGCFTFLKAIESKNKSNATWYCLFDFKNVDVSSRNRLIGNIESCASIQKIEYLFLDKNSTTTLRDKLNVCKSDHTPHLIAVNSLQIETYCHEVLFDEGKPVKYFARKIHEFFSSR